MVLRLLLFSLLSLARAEEELTLRLSASPYFGAGYVEAWRDGRWRAVCAGPGSWSQSTAHLVCRHLGYSESSRHQLGETSYAPQPRGVFKVVESLSCPPGAEDLSQCQLSGSSDCSPAQVLSLICRPDAKSGCGPNSTAMLGHCYRVFQDEKTFPEAQTECQKISANLVEILSEKENLLLSSLVEKSPSHRPTTTYWTGGVISEIAGAKFTHWHGSQNKIVFHNNIDKNGATEKPHGISFQTQKLSKYPGWRTEDMDTRLPFICQNVPENIGCLKAEDPRGLSYVGPASRDKEGTECAAWNSDPAYPWADNYCRNPDNHGQPYCLLAGGELSNCDVPLCSLLPRPSQECRAQAGASVDTCHKEEYHCRGGRCISTSYVCDGARDCPDGDDEEDCRVLSSLFVVTENYKLEGNLKKKTSESVRASLEECARLCLYQKMNGTGCCDSFSHRAARDGKDDRCTLGSVYVTNSINSSIDSLVEKKAWNYYKLNDTANTNSQCGLNFNWKRDIPGKPHLVAVRLNNKQRGSKGNLLEVKLVGQDWGGVCSDGFGLSEASLVCRQVGFQLGARRVLAVAGRPVVSGLRCGGLEQSLAQCSLSDHLRCPSGQVVALDCLKSRCEETEFQCGSGECIGTAGLCDSVAQCKDGSDETEQHCGALRTDVRLTQPGGHKGLLELRHRGVWGTVCEFNFGPGEADVFCHMLGYDRAANWTSGELEVSRSGSWPVWISFGSPGSCTGTEETLEECHDKSHWNDDQSCRHAEDVFLECKNDDPAHQVRTGEKTVQLESQCGLWRRLPQEREESGRVTGGRSVEHGLLPWQASIRLEGPSQSYHHCGAVIISPHYVLTAAHCLWPHRDNIEIYYVRVGDNALQIKDEGEAEYAIGKVDFHENFNVGPYQNNDIALVQIDKTKHSEGIRFGDKVIPACLPQKDADYSSQVNVTVSGWGKTNLGSSSVSRLQMVNLPLIEPEVCRAEEVYGEEKISRGMFCAGRLEGGEDSCQGDSGGPAVSLLPVPEYGEVRATLLGLTSWGYGCGKPNKPGVYTRLSQYVDWIHRRVTRNNNN